MIDNVRLPVHVERGSRFSLQVKTEIQTALSGKEQRVAQWDDARWVGDVSYGIDDVADLRAVFDLWRGRVGPAYPFRVKIWMDYQASNVAIGTGDGSTATFQLVKIYTDTIVNVTKIIQLPVNGTVHIFVAAVEKTETTHYTVNYSTGVVTFTGGNIPTAGQAITATFEFDIPMRFDGDEILAALRENDLGDIPSIDLIEVFDE